MSNLIKEMKMETAEQEISLDEIIQVMKKHWKLILFPSFLVAVLTGIFLHFQPKYYDSFSLIKIGNAGGTLFESVQSVNNIMRSFPVRQQIAGKLNERDNLKFINAINSSIEYTDEGGLLKIRAVDIKPERAAEMAKVSTDMVIERHSEMYLNAQETDKALQYVKKTINPIPLSCSIGEFKAKKTEVLVLPFVNKEPIKTKRKLVVIMVFFSMLFITILMSFIVEGRKK